MESSSVIVRNHVRETDIEECRALMRELTSYHREMYDRPTLGGEYPQNDADLETVDPSLFWVAAQSSKIIGVVGLLLTTDSLSKKTLSKVDPIVVNKQFRGKGIGERLIAKAVAEARARGAAEVAIKHLARNIKTIQFSHKQGFTYLGEIELFMPLSERTRKPGPRIYDCDFNM